MGESKMSIMVVPADKGRFKVLDNYIQHGIEYSSKDLANSEANRLRISRGLPTGELDNQIKPSND